MGRGPALLCGVGWGTAIGAALVGLGVYSSGEALQAILLAAGLSGAAYLARGFTAGPRLPLAARRAAELAVLMPAWPPPAFREAQGRGFLSAKGLPWTWGWRAISPAARVGTPSGARWAVGLGWGALAGMALGGLVADGRVAALQAFHLPRMVWVGGYASGGTWTATAWSARLRLVAARVETDRCPLPGQGRAVPGAVEVKAPPGLARQRPMAAGRWVCVRGLLRIPDEVSIPGAFSPRRYLNARGVLTYLEVRSPDRLVAVELPGTRVPFSLWLRARAVDQARSAARRLTALAGERAGAWFRAVALGEAEALDDQRRTALQASGLGHLTSVSGMHIGLLAGPLALAARQLRRRAFRWTAAVAATLGGWLYAAATGMESPSVRALLVQGILLMTALVGRRLHLWPALGWAAALQLLHNPYLARDAGFQLSYAATAGIAAVVSARSHGPEVLLPPQPTPATKGKEARRTGLCRRLGRVAGWAAKGPKALAVSAGAWAAAAPVAGYHFGWVSPWGVLASALAGFLALVLVWSGLLAWLLPLPLARAGGWAMQAAAELLEGLVWLGADLAGRWPVLVPRTAWLGFGAMALIGIGQRGGVAGSRGLLVAAGLAGLATWQGAWPSDGAPTVVGQPLGGSAWLMVGGAGGGPAWAVVATGSAEPPRTLGARLGAAMGAAGVHRLALVVIPDRGTAHAAVVEAMGPPAASALVLSLKDGSFAVENRLLPVAGQPVRQVWVGRVALRPVPSRAGDGAGPAVEFFLPGLDPLRVDGRGCAKIAGRHGMLCASRRPVALRAGPGGWEELG